MASRAARLRAFAEEVDAAAADDAERDFAGADELTIAIGAALSAAYPALRASARANAASLATFAREGWRSARKRADLIKRITLACAEAASLDPREATQAAIGTTLDAVAVRRGLRRATAVEKLRIALREIDPGIDVDVTAREWSELAEAQIEVALVEARRHVERRFGPIRTSDGAKNGFVVLGLGKLGGAELNAGSDVDLIFLHESDESDGACELVPFEAFSRVARRLTATLEDHDDDGFCARVDLRLRPEGASGALTNSIAAATTYYESFGRAWERAALLRARAVAGDLAVGERALRELTPFVYRRAVDPSVALDMEAMVLRSRVELSEAPARDLKLGAGGIREAEFFVQTLQLIWGGRDPSVRATNTLAALRRLRTHGYVTDREARAVTDGYLALRRAEHRVQLSTGVQTHLIPREGDERERLARSMGFRDGASFVASLDRIRARISERFASLVPGSKTAAAAEDERASAIVASLDAESEAATRTPDVTALLTLLRPLARRADGPLGSRTRERHPRFARSLVRAILDAADPEQAAGLVRTFFDRLAAPSVETYVKVLEADDRALSRFVGLTGASAYLGGSLVGHPELADLVLFATGLARDEAAGAHLLAQEIAALGHAERVDPESFVGALRRAKSALELAVGLRDLAGEIETREAGRALSVMAEATLDAATRWALDEIAQKRAPHARAPLEGLAVLAMGKLGGREIGYGSDLDVVFVYDPHALERLGLDPLDAGEIYGRVATRVIRLISAMHESGAGYDLDTRLRPSGEQGALVASIDGFRTYHLGREGEPPRAQEWERQALIRLRPCAGDTSVGALAQAVATEAAYAGHAIDTAELLRLRTRLETEVAREREGRYDVKLGRGGLVDVEFAVQLLQLRAGSDDPSVRVRETAAAIDALEAGGHLDAAHATSLREGWRFLRRLEQRARIVHASRAALLEESAPGLTPLARSMGYRDRGDATASAQMMSSYREVSSDVRRVFEAIVVPRAR